MKKILLILTALFICINADAQWSRVTPNLAYADSLYNMPVGTLMHRSQQKKIDDSEYALLNALYSLLGSAGDLQTVTGIGNTTTHGIVTYSSGITNYVGSTPTGAFTTLGGQWLEMSDATGTYAHILEQPTLTGYRYSYLPDEGTYGGGLSSTLVLHTTKDPVTVGTSSSNASTYDIAGLKTVVSGTTTTWLQALNAGFSPTGHAGEYVLYLKDKNNPYVGVITPGATNLTATRFYTLPDKSGTFAMLSDVTGTTGLNNTLITGNTTNYLAGARWGKVISTNPYSSAKIYMSSDSSGAILLQDSSNLNKISLTTIGTGDATMSLSKYDGNTALYKSTVADFNNAIASKRSTLDAITGLTLSDSLYVLGNYVPRVDSTTSASSFTPNLLSKDCYIFTALTANLTLNNPTGIFYWLKPYTLVIKDASTHTLTWGSAYKDGATYTLPTATATGTMYLFFTAKGTDHTLHLQYINIE